MKVTSCKSSGMEVSPAAYNACTFQIIDKWNPDQHAKTCDTMFYLSDGTGAYVWDCDRWKFLDFTGVTQSDWEAKQNEAGYIKNKPFKTLGNGLSVDRKGVLNVNLTLEPIMYKAYANSADGTDGFTTVYPNLNLEQHTAQLIGTDNKLIWGQTGNRTETTTYESVSISDDSRIKTGIRFTQITIGQSGWRGPSGSNGGSIPVVSGEKYTISVYLKNNSSNDVIIDLQLGTSATVNQDSPKYVLSHITVPANSDYEKYSTTVTIPSGKSYAWCYAYTKNTTTSADWSMAGYKLEQGSTATPWMPSASEVTTADWPKYAGHYASLSKEQSLDPKKYIWESSETNTVNSVNGKSKDVILKGTDIIVSADDSRTVSEAIKDSGNGKATSAEKLSKARDLKVDLTSKLAQSFDGSADATTIGVTGTLPLANGGTGNNKGEAIPKTTNANTSLTNGTINTNAKNAVLKYRILNDVIYISGSIDVVASDSNGESIKVGNIPEQYQPKKLINGVGKVHLNVGLFSKGFENAQVVVVGDENAAAKGAVMFSVQSTAKLTAGTWTFFGSYNLI